MEGERENKKQVEYWKKIYAIGDNWEHGNDCYSQIKSKEVKIDGFFTSHAADGTK